MAYGGNGVAYINELSCSTSSPVSTEVGDRLAGIVSWWLKQPRRSTQPGCSNVGKRKAAVSVTVGEDRASSASQQALISELLAHWPGRDDGCRRVIHPADVGRMLT